MHLKTCAPILAALALTIPAAPQTPTPAAKPKSTTTSTAKPAATYDHALLKPALLKDKAPDTYQVQFDTTRGIFTVTVNRAWSPLGADRFYNLVKHHYFDNARFFRVLPGFVVQFGLHANPTVNAAWEKATIKDDPRAQGNARGTLVFATAGPNTRTTQFFINYADNARLDSMGFAPFGSVVEGMPIVDKIFPGYREQPQQDQITDHGDAYLKANFPMIDKIKFARILPAAPPLAHSLAKPATRPSARPVNH